MTKWGRKLRTKWRTLQTRAKALFIAGVMSVVGLVGGGVGSFFKDEVKGWLGEVAKPWVHDLSCKQSIPSRPIANQPVVLFPKLGNDPADEAWKGILLMLTQETDFDVVPSCMRFEIDTRQSMQTARANFLAQMDPQLKAINADMLLFGSVYAPRQAQIWSANSLGGCDWQKSTPTNLGNPTASEQVLASVRSSLIRVILEGLVAACEREHTGDWQAVGRIVDIVIPFVEKKKSIMTEDDYHNVQLHIYGISYSHYNAAGGLAWLDRSLKSLDALSNDATVAKNPSGRNGLRGKLALLYWEKYQQTHSLDDLRVGIGILHTVQQEPLDWNDMLFASGVDVADAMETAVSAGLSTAKPEDIGRIRAAATDLPIAKHSDEIKKDPKNALAYNDRGDAYLSKKEYDRAIIDYSQAVSLAPTNADYLNSICWGRAIEGRDLDQALAECNRSLQLRPAHGNTLNSRGLVQIKRGAFREAIEDFNAAIKINSLDADSLYARGFAKLKAGSVTEGEADIASAKAIKPKIAEVYTSYGLQ